MEKGEEKFSIKKILCTQGLIVLIFFLAPFISKIIFTWSERAEVPGIFVFIWIIFLFVSYISIVALFAASIGGFIEAYKFFRKEDSSNWKILIFSSVVCLIILFVILYYFPELIFDLNFP